MKIGPRARLLAIASIFVLPIAASLIAYRYARPPPTANYGELLLPPASLAGRAYARAGGGQVRFSDSGERWALVTAADPGCDAACEEKLVAMRQVRLALGRNASRVERVVFMPAPPAENRIAAGALEGTSVAITAAAPVAQDAEKDPMHIYLVDPHGNVMMRWPARPDMRRMLRDLERLLKASQIG